MVLNCDDSIDLIERPESDYEIVLGGVALPTASVTAALQTSRTAGPPVRYFAKRGLLVRNGAALELTVIGPAHLDGAVGWGNSADFSRTLQVGGCPGDTHQWRAFAGGFETARTGCLTLEVRTGEQARRVKIGVGAACPGQDPPPSPSDS